MSSDISIELTSLCAQKEEKKDDKPPKSPKIGRRLSARVGDFFKPKHREPSVPAKVAEADAPPMIEEPAPVAPLENPAAEAEAVPAPTTEAPVIDEPKVEAPPAVPQVAAAA